MLRSAAIVSMLAHILRKRLSEPVQPWPSSAVPWPAYYRSGPYLRPAHQLPIPAGPGDAPAAAAPTTDADGNDVYERHYNQVARASYYSVSAACAGIMHSLSLLDEDTQEPSRNVATVMMQASLALQKHAEFIISHHGTCEILWNGTRETMWDEVQGAVGGSEAVRGEETVPPLRRLGAFATELAAGRRDTPGAAVIEDGVDVMPDSEDEADSEGSGSDATPEARLQARVKKARVAAKAAWAARKERRCTRSVKLPVAKARPGTRGA